MKQDNQILKYDRDNLTKQLEEYDLYVKTYKEKVSYYIYYLGKKY